MDLLEVFRENRELIKERFGVKKICVFGSSVGGEEKEESDVDVLVEFGRVKRPCDNFMELVFFLGELFEKKVYLVTSSGLNQHVRPYVEREVVLCEER